MICIGDRRLVFSAEAPVATVAWHSTRIRRVVKSTLAAEACAMAAGYDAAVQIRVLLPRLLSSSSADRAWQDEVYDVPQLAWTDCKSLLDFLVKDGGMPTERRVALDIYDVQQYLPRDDMEWAPSGSQIADCLTKHFSENEANSLSKVLAEGKFKLPTSCDSLPTGPGKGA